MFPRLIIWSEQYWKRPFCWIRLSFYSYFILWKPANILLKQSKGNYRTASSFKNRRSWRFIFCWSTDGAAQQLSELVTRLLNRLCLKKKNWEPYGSRRGEDEDDVSSLAAVDSPVLRPLQAGDAHVASLQAPHVGAGLIEEKKNHLFLNHRRINDWSCGVLYWQVKPKPKIIFPMICCEIYTGTVAELQGCAETWVNSQNTKPGLLVTNAGGGGGHALDGLWQEVNCGSQRSFNVNTSEPNTSSQSADVFFFFFVPSPLNSLPPASVNSEFMTSSASQLPWPSSTTWVSIRLRTSSRVAAFSSKRMLAWARKPSRSLWARTSSWKFIGFTYWCEPRTTRGNNKFCCRANKILKVSLLIFVFSPSSELILARLPCSLLMLSELFWSY